MLWISCDRHGVDGLAHQFRCIAVIDIAVVRFVIANDQNNIPQRRVLLNFLGFSAITTR